MRSTLCIAVLVFAGGCSSANYGQTTSRDSDFIVTDSYFSYQQGCMSAWRVIVDDWVSAGGGVRRTIGETKSQIESDGNSVFARVVNGVWELQRRGGKSDLRSISMQFLEVSGQLEPSGSFPQECGSIIWVESAFADGGGAFVGDARDSLLEIAPTSAKDDSDAFAQWVLQEILTREP